MLPTFLLSSTPRSAAAAAAWLSVLDEENDFCWVPSSKRFDINALVLGGLLVPDSCAEGSGGSGLSSRLSADKCMVPAEQCCTKA